MYKPLSRKMIMTYHRLFNPYEFKDEESDKTHCADDHGYKDMERCPREAKSAKCKGNQYGD